MCIFQKYILRTEFDLKTKYLKLCIFLFCLFNIKHKIFIRSAVWIMSLCYFWLFLQQYIVVKVIILPF